MTDVLTKWFNEKVKPDMSEYQSFQQGVTAGAVSMRERAVKVVQTKKEKNDIINSIGQLADIPQE